MSLAPDCGDPDRGDQGGEQTILLREWILRRLMLPCYRAHPYEEVSYEVYKMENV